MAYDYTKLGPKSDDVILNSIPHKLESIRVLYKYSDKWDGSCSVIAIEISDGASEKITKDGLSFLENISFPNNADKIARWTKSSLKEEAHLRDIRAAIRCSNVDSDFKNKALALIDVDAFYYQINKIARTYYLIIPEERLLLITHFD